MRDRWYKNAVIYCLDVETFQDSNGDGIGDFAGLTSRLDYLAGLGVTCIWLLPFYPSPNRDNGYDITDYYAVDPRLGSLGDFVECMRHAHERGMRVLIDLVVNHTSDQHPWFQAARRDPHSPYRDYYIWSADKPPDADQQVVFPGVQQSTWTWDAQAGAYYHHRFYEHQPDLNIANPAVREEINKIMGFWLQLGVSGFRVDAAPFLIDLPSFRYGEAQDRYQYLRALRETLSWRRGDAILLAEANVDPQTLRQYVGDGDRMHLLFNFYLNQHLFLALVREQAQPIIESLRALPPIPPTCQWANFVRNHDELTLDRLTPQERQEILDAFAPEPNMRIYGRGIRRRLPPMLNGDRRRMALAYSLMFTLPGTPVLRYGEEIGMGDDLSLRERDSVRTPMQWNDQPHAGFSSATGEDLIYPLIDHGPFRYQCVNVASQQRDPTSFLNTIERMIRTRKECPEFAWGTWQIVDPGTAQVLALRYELEGRTVVTLHNLGRTAQRVRLALGRGALRLIDLLSAQQHALPEGAPYELELEGYGYRWLRLVS